MVQNCGASITANENVTLLNNVIDNSRIVGIGIPVATNVIISNCTFSNNFVNVMIKSAIIMRKKELRNY